MMTDWQGWLPGGGSGGGEGGLLKDRVAFVAGGAGGIGEAVTRILAAAGATVVVADAAADRAADVTGSVQRAGGSAIAVTADLRDEESAVGAVAEAAERAGGIDILANITGGMHAHAPWAPVGDWTTDHWDAIVQLNLRYVFWTCRAVIPLMEARGGGTIVNVGSVAALSASPGQSAYGAAKAAVLQLTRTLAVECGPAGIRVNAVSPGITLTPPARVAMAGKTGDAYRAATPTRTLSVPEDLARAVLYFASPMSANVTGQDLAVDGGISVNFPYAGLGSSQ